MRILMIAPQPFFQPRGTPFSEFYRIRALTELGHDVDLVTYPIGEDVDIPGLTIYRTPSVGIQQGSHRAFAREDPAGLAHLHVVVGAYARSETTTSSTATKKRG